MSDLPLPDREIIREFSDRSTLWLLEDPANLRDLLRILEPAVADCLDFNRAQRVNRSFIQADLRKKESDLIFRVPAQSPDTETEVWVYVLLEHQSAPDRELPLRLLLYMTQLWDLQRREWDDRGLAVSARFLSPVVPLVLYTGTQDWSRPLHLKDLFTGPPELTRFAPDWETLRLNLHATTPEALTGINSAIGWALQVLRAEKAPLDELQQALTEAIHGLEALSEEQAGQWSRVAWYLLLLIFHRREPSEYTELQKTFWAEVRRSKFREGEEVTQMAMTMAEYVREQGRVEGRVEGERQALRHVLITNLEFKFGPLPTAALTSIEHASEDQILAWHRQAMVADKLTDVGITD